MRRCNNPQGLAQDALIILGFLLVFTFMCRLWPFTLIILICMIVVAVRKAFLRRKKEEVEEQKTEVREEKPVTQQDVYDMAYGVILERITMLVHADYPDAKWVWEHSNAKEKIQEGEEVFICLNQAGGYQKAKVHIKNLKIECVEYIKKPMQEQPIQPVERRVDKNVSEELPVNYGLMAFDWVEAHIDELNARCNDAIGQGKEELILTAEELPVQESWANICEELKRVDLTAVEVIPEGIRITLLQ